MVTHVSWGFRFRSSGGEFKTRRAAFRYKMWSGETGGGGEREASLWWLTHLNPLTSGTDFSFWKSAWINRLGFRVAGDLRKWKLSAFCTGFKERFYRVSWSFDEGPAPPSPPPLPNLLPSKPACFKFVHNNKFFWVFNSIQTTPIS